jgi:DNA-binding SARP family transcriptional activator
VARSTSFLRHTAAGVTSLVTLIALAVGVPLALSRLAGWPLPAALPSLHEIAHALSRNEISDSTFFKALALVGWFAWVQIAASILVEAIAWVRGGAAPRLRFAEIAQPAICKLITSVALLTSSVHVPNVAPLVIGRQLSPAVTLPVPVEMPAAFLVRADAPARTNATTRPAATRKTYTVVRYDTLWGLADKHLSDPLRWREIFELNLGKDQPDGRALEDPKLIIPGWVLTMPANATGVDEEAAVRAPVTTPAEPITTHQAPQHHHAPAAAATSPTTTASAPVPPPSTVPAVTTEPAGRAIDPSEHHSERGIDPALLIGGGLAAASIVALLDRLRRVQRRSRRAGRPIAAPGTESERVERRLRRAADLDDAELLDLALRAFAAGVAGRRTPPPAILAVRIGGGQVEILSDRPPERPPKGFRTTDDARGWITDPESRIDDLRELTAGACAPLPALIALGDIDGDRLLVDVESAGTLTVDGIPERVSAFIRHIAVELATSTWVDHVDVLAVGMTELDIVGAQRIHHLTDIDAALDELEAAAHTVGDALESAQYARTLEARMSEHPDDGWIPTILACADPLEPDVLARVRAITGDGGRGTGAVVHSTVHAEWHAWLGDTELLLTPLGFRIAPALLDLPTATAIDELLTDIAVEDASDALDPPSADEVEIDLRATEPYIDPPFEVEVRVLGPIEIMGGRSPLERQRCIELATYLALHPNGASDERLKTVLWPDRAPSTATFNTTVSTTRSRLGHTSDGTPHFPHLAASGGVYQLGPLVTTDLARFEARVAHARLCDPTTAINTLRSALELVRGKPFDDARGFEWAFSEALIANVEATIADAAHQLATLYLDAGDPQEATRAALRGLVAAPGDEILYRDRMLACDLAGNPAGVETVMDELCEVVEALEPYDELHPETLALYERISHRKRSRPINSR